MSDSSASYIHMVQHLIEKCLIFRMSKEECMEALSKHANIKPVITSTVWSELEKVNKEFFESYSQSQSSSGANRMSEAETSELIQKMISDNQSNNSDKDDE
ncbi:polyribonucleotide nucleotidyltransferase [Tanacetum coccineum]|uniref:Polyribonucleotide nucleotidyltransferase n=1 Tax=Tanacetum coccineum TaxID=301880 RepID=A0ABQ5FGY5_9ASTR